MLAAMMSAQQCIAKAELAAEFAKACLDEGLQLQWLDAASQWRGLAVSAKAQELFQKTMVLRSTGVRRAQEQAGLPADSHHVRTPPDVDFELAIFDDPVALGADVSGRVLP